jgi:hypothetical protein
MNQTMASECARSQEEVENASAPRKVDSSDKGRIAGYKTKQTPANANESAVARFHSSFVYTIKLPPVSVINCAGIHFN